MNGGSRLLTLLAATAFFAAGARAQTVEVEAHVGFDGVLPSAGLWPVTLAIANPFAEDLEFEVEIRGGAINDVEATGARRRVILSPQASRQISFLQCGGSRDERSIVLRARRPLDWRIHGPALDAVTTTGSSQAELALAAQPRLRSTDVPIVVLGPKAAQIAGALPATVALGTWSGVGLVAGSRARATFAALAAPAAPESPLAWSQVRTILWTEPDPAAFFDPAQMRSLTRWVELGGHLIVSSARHPELLDAPALAALLPGRVRGAPEARYGEIADAFDMGSVPEAPLAGPLLDLEPAMDAEPIDGRALAPGLRFSPAGWRRRVGLGRVTLARFEPLIYDLGSPDRLLRALRVLGVPAEYHMNAPPAALAEAELPRERGGLGGARFRDALENETIVRPPLIFFFGLGLVYVWLIWPFDFKYLRRRRLLRYSALTLLAYAVAFAGASVIATSFIFASKEEVNRLAIADFAEGVDGAELVQGRAFHGIFSRLGGRYDVAPDPAMDAYSQPNPQPAYASFRKPPVRALLLQDREHGGRQIFDARLPAQSFRGVETAFSGIARESFDARIAADSAASARRVITVRNGFAAPLRHVLLAQPSGYRELPDVPAGGVLEVDVSAAPEPYGSLIGAGVQRSSRGALAVVDLGPLLRVRREPADPADPNLVLALRLGSLAAWLREAGIELENGDASRSTAPWDLSARARGDAVILAMVDAWPPGEASPRPAEGFSFSLVRRLVPQPAVK
jgi:hypothetical protein